MYNIKAKSNECIKNCKVNCLFIEIDTFHYKDAPNIHGCVEIDNQKVHFITSMTVPPVDMRAFQEIENHLKLIIFP